MRENVRAAVNRVREALLSPMSSLESCRRVITDGIQTLAESQDSVFLKDSSGQLRFQNAEFTRTFAGGSDQTGRKGSLFLPDSIRGLSAATDQVVITQRSSSYTAYRLPCGNSFRVFETLKTPLLSGAMFIGMLGISREVPDEDLKHFPELEQSEISAVRNAIDAPIAIPNAIANELAENDGLLSRLSGRQLEVLRLLAHGFTKNEIAQELLLSPRTVEKHRRTLLQRLEMRNIAQLISTYCRSSHFLSEPTDSMGSLGRRV